MLPSIPYRPNVSRNPNRDMASMLLILMLLLPTTGQTQIILHEFLADPDYGLTGDANQDGFRHPDEDDFVELWNAGSGTVDLSGWSLWDGFAERHVFPSGTVLPGGMALVVFGGGQPRGWFGNALVQTASSGSLSLSQYGDRVVLKLPGGFTLWSHDYGPEASKGLSISLTGTGSGVLLPHTDVPDAAGRRHSPGTRADGLPFGIGIAPALSFVQPRVFGSEDSTLLRISVQLLQAGSTGTRIRVYPDGGSLRNEDWSVLPEGELEWAAGSSGVRHLDGIPLADGVAEGLETARWRMELLDGPAGTTLVVDTLRLFLQDPDLRSTLVLNEIHADPAPGTTEPENGDANRDGVRDAGDDAFVEIVHAGSVPLDISGYRLYDRGRLRHQFPAGTILPSGEAVVVFGGGNPSGAFGEAIVQTASTGSLSLSNTGDTIVLEDARGSELWRLVYGPEAHQNQSINRPVDVTGTADWALHLELPSAGGRRYSPGTQVDGTPFPNWMGWGGAGPVPDPEWTVHPNPARAVAIVRHPGGALGGTWMLSGSDGRVLDTWTVGTGTTQMRMAPQGRPSGTYRLCRLDEAPKRDAQQRTCRTILFHP